MANFLALFPGEDYNGFQEGGGGNGTETTQNLYPPTDSIRTLPQNMYMSVVSGNTSMETQYARKLYEEMGREGMQPCGDYICEVLTQFPLGDSGQLIYKIQVPVRKKGHLADD